MKRRWLFLVLLTACAPRAAPRSFQTALALGERAQSAGRHDEAAKAYEAAALGTPREEDRDHALFLAALAHERAGERAAAMRIHTLLSASRREDGPAAQALYRSMVLRAQVGDHDADFREVFVRHPRSGVARMALRRWLEDLDQKEGPSASLDALRKVEPQLHTTDMGESIAYAIAERLVRLQQPAAARDAYLAMAATWPYPRGALWDNALYHASILEESLGRPSEAIAHLERMLKEREPSHGIGSYERPLYSRAQFRIGRLYETRLGSNERAKAAYHRLYADMTTSRLRDDALWRESRILRKEGSQDEACKTLRVLLKNFPDSRYAACAKAECEAAGKESPCPTYLRDDRYDPLE